jgi:hypothetical protein
MIRGFVQVIQAAGTPDEEILFSENNMIVDGAAETIATMMTIPPDLSFVSSASSIYDTSNFTIQAVSLGKAPIQYYLNAHRLTGPEKYGREASGQVWVSGIGASGVSSYVPLPYLPTSPSPYDSALVDFTDPNFKLAYSNVAVSTFYDVLNYTNIRGIPFGWGDSVDSTLYAAPAGLSSLSKIESGRYHFISLGLNGEVSCWGGNNPYGELNVPVTLGTCTDVAAGRYNSFAVESDGTLVAWGRNLNGSLDFPAGYTSNVSSVVGSFYYSSVLKSDGTVSTIGSGPVPRPPSSIQGLVSKISSHWSCFHVLALLNDGSVSGWLDIAQTGVDEGQLTFPAFALPAVDIAAADLHSLICFSDGTVSAFGQNTYGQCNVPEYVQGNAVKVFAGKQQSFALLNDGQVFGWGNTGNSAIGTLQVPNDPNKKITHIAIGDLGKFAFGVCTSSLPYTTVVSEVENRGFYSSENFKQNVNLIEFKDKIINKINLNNETINIIPSTTGALLDGAYAPSAGITLRVVSGTEPYTTIATKTVSGDFNTQGSIDFRGYIRKLNAAESVAGRGLVVSSISPSTTGEITYQLKIGRGDCTTANLYGGITSLGLWTYDTMRNVNNGYNPPFVFRRYPEETGTYIPLLDYKLFAKKTFNTDITRAKDNLVSNLGAIDRRFDLAVIWKLYFL